MKNFDNKVAVITGAASGLGRELAIAGAEFGSKLVLADVQIDALNSLKAELEKKGAEVVVMQCDVSKSEEVKALADTAIDQFGVVNLLFNKQESRLAVSFGKTRSRIGSGYWVSIFGVSSTACVLLLL